MSPFTLSILICTLPERAVFLRRLTTSLERQSRGFPVEILTDNRGRNISIGAKRNMLLKRARGEYVAFIDDDDEVAANYVQLVLQALGSKPDCAELRGEITTNGKNPKPFIHTVACKEWHEKDGVYWRMPNHLNAIRRDLALQAGFPENNYGEDHEFSKRVQLFLKTQGDIPQTIYYYRYRSNKRA